MRTFLLLTVLGTLLLQAGFTEDPLWLSNPARALEIGKKAHKFILLNFSLSDVCPACVAMRQQVFSSTEFKEFASNHLVLVELNCSFDTPRKFEEQRDLEFMIAHYRVSYYPTFILLNPDGEHPEQIVADTNPSKFIQAIKNLTR